jgi:division protein CdvB (Snf7/Vps24/ESCRT-III family)
MDSVQVQRAVGLSFKEVAEEANSNHTQRTPATVVSLTPQAVAERAEKILAEIAGGKLHV